MNLRDIVVRNALLHPKRDALVFEGARITYADFAKRAFRLANALLGLGVRAQERVAVLAPNCPAYLEAFGACESAGSSWSISITGSPRASWWRSGTTASRRRSSSIRSSRIMPKR